MSKYFSLSEQVGQSGLERLGESAKKALTSPALLNRLILESEVLLIGRPNIWESLKLETYHSTEL